MRDPGQGCDRRVRLQRGGVGDDLHGIEKREALIAAPQVKHPYIVQRNVGEERVHAKVLGLKL
jgi:hypothetical protein